MKKSGLLSLILVLLIGSLSAFPPPNCQNNLLKNAGFEDGFAHWNTFNIGTISNDANTGNNAAEIQLGFYRITQLVAAQPGETYTLQADIKTNPTGEHGSIGLKFLTANWQPDDLLSSKYVLNDYETIELTRTAPSNTVWIEISIYSSSYAAVLVDDVCLTKVNSLPCSIVGTVSNAICDNNNTPSDPSDDTFDLYLDVTGSGIGSTFEIFRSYSAGSPRETKQYGTDIYMGKFPVINGGFTYYIEDTDNPDCRNDITVPRQEACSTIPPLVCNGNLLTNGDFENGIVGWNFPNGAVGINEDPLEINSGNASVNYCNLLNIGIPNPPPLNYSLYQRTPVLEGATYELSFYMRSRFNVGCGNLTFYDADGNFLDNGVRADTCSSTSDPYEYKLYKYSEVAPIGAVECEVSFNVNPFGLIKCVDLDDVCVKKIADPISGPELVIKNAQCPSEYPIEGAELSVDFTVENTGDSASAPRNVYLYRWRNCRFCSSDNLGMVAIPSLQAGESLSLSVDGTFPGTIPGSYYVPGVLVPNDYGDFFLSFDLLQYPNNEALIDFYCKKFDTDLSVKITPLAAEYNSSGAIHFKLEATNNGSQYAYNVGVITLDDIQLFQGNVNSVIDADEPLSATSDGLQWFVESLAPGETRENNVTYQLLGPGQYAVLPASFEVRANISSGHNTNTNSGNDTSEFTFNKESNQNDQDGNLTLVASGSPTNISAWQFGWTEFEIKNEGDVAVEDIFVSFEMDAGAKLKGGDEFSSSQGTVGQYWTNEPVWNVGTLSAGASASVVFNIFSLTDEAITFYGQVTQASISDPTSSPGNGVYPIVNEDDESVFIFNDDGPPVLIPDLTVSNLFLDQLSVKTGEILNYTFDVANIGDGNAPGDFSIKAYISTDGDLSADDVQDGVVPTGNFNAGFSLTEIPGASTINLPDGQYYIILKVDADDQVNESDESNNETVSFLTFEVDNEDPVSNVCDKEIGNGTMHCFESISGTSNYKVVYDSSGYRTEKTLDANLDVINTFTPTEINPPTEKLVIDTTSFKKIDADGNLVYSKTIPPGLFDKLNYAPRAIEFDGDYVFFAWRNQFDRPSYSLDSLFAIRTDLNFNIKNEELVCLGSGYPYGNRVNGIDIVNNNRIALWVKIGSSTSQSLLMFLLDEQMQTRSQETFISNVYALGASVAPNVCRGFTVTDFIGLSYCKSGGCYRRDVIDGVFNNDSFETENSNTFVHQTQLGYGTESWSWFAKTSDGGKLLANRNQQLPLNVNALDESVHFEKYDSANQLEWEQDILISGANDISRIYENDGDIFVVKRIDEALTVSKLDCYENTQSFPDLVVDLVTPVWNTVNIGEAVSVHFNAKNKGQPLDQSAFPLYYSLYMSRNQQLEAWDTKILDLPIGIGNGLGMGGQVPVNLAPGEYYLIVEVDSPNNILEGYENNNWLSSETPVWAVNPPGSCAFVTNDDIGDGLEQYSGYELLETNDNYQVQRSIHHDVLDRYILNLEGEIQSYEFIPYTPTYDVSLQASTDGYIDMIFNSSPDLPTGTVERVELNYPNPTPAVYSNSKAFKTSTGYAFGVSVIDLSLSPNVVNMVVRTDNFGQNAEIISLPNSAFYSSFSRLIEGKDGGLYSEWKAAGNFSLFGVQSNSTNAWHVPIASDTPSSTWVDTKVSFNGNQVYVAKTDNQRAYIFQISTFDGSYTFLDLTDLETNGQGVYFQQTSIQGIAPTKDNGLLVSMKYSNYTNNISGIVLAKLDFNGQIIWELDLPGDDYTLRPVGETSDKGGLFAGTYQGEGVFVKTTATGELTPLCGGNSNDGVDIELSYAPLNNPTPGLWSPFSVTFMVENKGTEAASGIDVSLNLPNGLVYEGGNEYQASQGSLAIYGNNVWNVGSLAPGMSATIQVNYYRVSGDVINLFAQVIAMDQDDIDSSPNNGVCCNSNEDDEAFVVLGSTLQNISTRGNISQSIGKQPFAIISAYPNPFNDQLRIKVFANEAQVSDLQLIDVLGRVVYSKEVSLESGLNLIDVEIQENYAGMLTIKMTPFHPYLRQIRVLRVEE